MRDAHALNLFDSLHTMFGMESLKRSGTAAPPVALLRSSSARRQSLQQSTIDRLQQRCQQQTQQQ